jgi:threonine dehydratase
MSKTPIPINEIYLAQKRVYQTVIKSPLVKLNVENPAEIYLKLENLQPTGAFKIRGSTNALLSYNPDDLARAQGFM